MQSVCLEIGQGRWFVSGTFLAEGPEAHRRGKERAPDLRAGIGSAGTRIQTVLARGKEVDCQAQTKPRDLCRP